MLYAKQRPAMRYPVVQGSVSAIRFGAEEDLMYMALGGIIKLDQSRFFRTRLPWAFVLGGWCWMAQALLGDGFNGHGKRIGKTEGFYLILHLELSVLWFS